MQPSPAADPSAAVDGARLHDLVRAELCQIVASQTAPILPPVLASQVLIAAIAWGHAPTWMILAWVACIAMVHVARFAMARVLGDASRPAASRVRMAVVMSATSGTVHAGAVLFLPYLIPLVQTVPHLLLSGLCAGSVAVNVGHRGIVLGFVGPIVAAIALHWFTALDPVSFSWEGYAIGLLMIYFGVTLIILAGQTWRIFEQSVAIRLENTELARRLETALRTAEAASTAKTRFLAAASHDLRQPLHTLAFLSAALELRPLDAKGREILQNMAGALDVLSSEFDMLLDISKLDAGIVSVSPSTFELGAFVARIVDTLTEIAAAKGLELRVASARDPIYVRTDRMLLERIVRNLVDNAIKYTVRGSVTVNVAVKGAHCEVAVRDTGIGIAASDRERVFEEFYQADNPERDRRRGLGLGLSIVRRLSDLLRLDLAMQSEQGAGTCFTLRLDRAERPEEQPMPARGGPPARFAGFQVLVIDDEADSRHAMRGYLEALGSGVSVAATVNEALALAQTDEPDLVVADFRLRGTETGLQAIGRLRATRPELPALLITGDTAPDRLAEIAASGIPVLHKPVAPARLVEAIAGLLRKAEVPVP